MSGSTYPTLSTTVPLYNSFIDHIEDTMAMSDPEQIIYDAVKECKTKLLGYYNKTNNACLIATVLNPWLKLRYYKDNKWGNNLINNI